MIVEDADSARAWLRAWGPRAFTLGRAERVIADMHRCASLCQERAPERAAGFRAAAAVVSHALAGAAR